MNPGCQISLKRLITVIDGRYVAVYDGYTYDLTPLVRFRISDGQHMPRYSKHVGKTHILISDLVRSCKIDWLEAVIIQTRIASNVLHAQVFFRCMDGVYLMVYGVNQPVLLADDWHTLLETLNILPEQIRRA